MEKQLIVIHGGDSYISEEEYLKALQERPFQLDWFRGGGGWKSNLQETLGLGFDVIAPYFPLRENARYEEWKMVFEKFLNLVDDGVIILGHSLGGMFAAKYFAENISKRKVGGLFIVAAPYTLETPYSSEFNVPGPLKNIEKQIPKTFIYHSTDDFIVSSDEVKKFEKALPSATVRIFEDRGHFLGDSFPEIIEDIKSV